jgi:hypothetical protein
MKIDRLKHSEIDFEKYDSCISSSPAANVYAMSWYLNIVSPNWNLLVADDYSVVMPLPVKKKYWFSYLTQPYFCQQLGVFASSILEKEVFLAFLKAIPYKYAKLQLNISNVFDFGSDKLRPNFVLSLNSPFSEISSFYGSNCQRNLKKAKPQNLNIIEIGTKDFMLLLKQNNSGIFSEEMLVLQERIIVESLKKGFGSLMAAESEGGVVAAVFVINTEKRIYYLCPVSSAEGKQKQAMSLIVNEIIEKNAGTNKTLDFEGSAIPGVANFYAGFGAKAEFYPSWKRMWF